MITCTLTESACKARRHTSSPKILVQAHHRVGSRPGELMPCSGVLSQFICSRLSYHCRFLERSPRWTPLILGQPTLKSYRLCRDLVSGLTFSKQDTLDSSNRKIQVTTGGVAQGPSVELWPPTSSPPDDPTTGLGFLKRLSRPARQSSCSRVATPVSPSCRSCPRYHRPTSRDPPLKNLVEVLSKDRQQKYCAQLNGQDVVQSGTSHRGVLERQAGEM
jgi:hypothetical protein